MDTYITLNENWELLQELFELPSHIDTKSYGDDFFNLKGEYGDSFEFHHKVTGKSGKVYNIIFRFYRKMLKSDGTISYRDDKGKSPSNIEVDKAELPAYDISFYPEEKETMPNNAKWELLNDINPTSVVTLLGYFVCYHASSLGKESVPYPFVRYIFSGWKEAHEKDRPSEVSKRGLFYNRAIPKIIDAISARFPNIKVADIAKQPEYTLITLQINA
jgi:hypothetical protein